MKFCLRRFLPTLAFLAAGFLGGCGGGALPAADQSVRPAVQASQLVLTDGSSDSANPVTLTKAPAKAAQAALVGITPQNGWWWNPAEGGRGFAIERQGDQIFIAAFLYETSGAPTWYVSTLQQQPNGVFTGNLTRYSGGQTLLGAFKAPSSSSNPASASLFFSSATTASLFVSQNDGSGSRTIAIERFPISSPAFAPSNAGFDTGWWWNEAEGGRGYFVEVQGNSAFIGSFMYDTNGEPTWYVSNATLTGTTSLNGALLQYSGGQSLQGAYQTPVAAGAPGNMKFDFSTSAAATMTLPSNKSVAVGRFWYNTPASVLAGRTWTAGTLLETDDKPVYARETSIDDFGRTVTVFLKSNGTRPVLYATRGSPNAAGIAPTWSTPVAIDTLFGAVKNGMTSSSYNFGVKSAPNGNAVAYWYNNEPCNSQTYKTKDSTCKYYYTSRYLTILGTWEAPVQVGDQPGDTFDVHINDNGDVAAQISGWVRSGTTSYSNRYAVAWRPNGAAAYTRKVFNDADLTAGSMDMDGAGNMLFAAEASQNSTTDIVAYRGTMAAGFVANQVLDTRGSPASLYSVALGSSGQQAVIYRQNDGKNSTIYAATSLSEVSSWSTKALKSVGTFEDIHVVISDEGVIYLIGLAGGYRFVWINGVWSGYQRIPNIAMQTNGDVSCDIARNGNSICVVQKPHQCRGGDWTSFDALRNIMPTVGNILNMENCPPSGGVSKPVLSVSGFAAVTFINNYDVLPTPAAPSGDGRNVTNLWGAFLK